MDRKIRENERINKAYNCIQKEKKGVNWWTSMELNFFFFKKLAKTSLKLKRAFLSIN